MNKKDLDAIGAVVKGALSGVESRLDRIDSRLDDHDKRFDSIESRLAGHDKRFDSIDSRVSSVEQDLRAIKVDLLENNIIPRLNTIEQCYIDTSRRYTESADKFDAAVLDIEVMKLAIQKNSEDIQELKMKQA